MVDGKEFLRFTVGGDYPWSESSILNRNQILCISGALVVCIALAIMPPWCYLNGSSGGFALFNNPPDALPDSLITDADIKENLSLIMVSFTFSNPERRKTEFTPEELSVAFIDIRKLLTIGILASLLGVIGLFAFDHQTTLSNRELTLLSDKKKTCSNGKSA